MSGDGKLVAVVNKKLQAYALAWCAADTKQQLHILEEFVVLIQGDGLQVERSGEVAKPELRAVVPLDRGTSVERRQRTRDLALTYGWDPKMNCTPFGYLRSFLEV